MGTDIERGHWEETILANENLIIQNKIQIRIAKEVIRAAKNILDIEFPKEKLGEGTPVNS